MKARDKKTGEIVDVERYGADGSYTMFRNSEGELITIDTAVRVFCDTWPQRRALSGKFERALRKAVGERMEVNVPEMSDECSEVKGKAEQCINDAKAE